MTVNSPAGAATDRPAADPDPLVPDPSSRAKRFRRRDAALKKAGRDTAPKKTRRSLGYWLVKGLRRIWMPLVIALVLLVAAFAVDRLHGFFGKSELTRPGSGLASDPEPFNPKKVTYEIFGPPGTVATVNYLDLDAEPQIARDVTLPWTLELSTTAPAAAANIVAQGDSDTIGCRITVDGVVKDEKTSTGVNAQTFCIVKSG